MLIQRQVIKKKIQSYVIVYCIVDIESYFWEESYFRVDFSLLSCNIKNFISAFRTDN